MPSSDNTTAIIVEHSSLSINSYCKSVGAALTLHDFFITIGDESKYFWGKRPKSAAALFYLNRSLIMLYFIFDILADSVPPGSEKNLSCAEISRAFYAIQDLMNVPAGAFTALRVFALSRSWALALLIFVLSVFPAVATDFALFRLGSVTGTDFPASIGCTIADAASAELVKLFVIISRTPLITADCLAILVTWLKLSSRLAPNGPDGQATHCLSKSFTFERVLLYDGTIYFIVIGVLNCLQLTFSVFSFETVSSQNFSFISAITGPLTAVMVSRFLLHLQSVQYLRTSGMSSSQFGSIGNFSDFIGSLDATLSPEDFLGDSASDSNVDLAVTPEVSDSSPSSESADRDGYWANEIGSRPSQDGCRV